MYALPTSTHAASANIYLAGKNVFHREKIKSWPGGALIASARRASEVYSKQAHLLNRPAPVQQNIWRSLLRGANAESAQVLNFTKTPAPTCAYNRLRSLRTNAGHAQ